MSRRNSWCCQAAGCTKRPVPAGGGMCLDHWEKHLGSLCSATGCNDKAHTGFSLCRHHMAEAERFREAQSLRNEEQDRRRTEIIAVMREMMDSEEFRDAVQQIVKDLEEL